jgi:hypothetical protein
VAKQVDYDKAAMVAKNT